MNDVDYEYYMRRALELAFEALAHHEVPVGAVIVDGRGVIIGEGRNRREEDADATAHAEIEAIRKACAARGNWRLDDCSIFVTLEPCPMCTGAIINSRIPVLVFGTRDSVTGSCGSVIDLFSESYGHSPAVYPGVLADECSSILKCFFESLRH